jgi:YrbI family 3-deoxy-D-manno-octulosonate 8-phosphate phosphatase|tara:strand:- start:9263 stop:9760 length:498 start_codon:yes stop_codon:yes gene_type:complete
MISKKISQKCKKIKLVVTDVDGVLTDGGMYYSEKGEVMKKFNARDGMAVELLLQNNIKTVLLTRENSTIIKKRGMKIKTASTITGIQNKESYLGKICKKFRVSPKEIAYIGDDVNDIAIIKLVGFSATPIDGIYSLQKIVNYVCKNKGGNGAFREFADLIIISRS